ncbi:hypothetical protein D3C80_1619900 [compost metagenome]
MFVAPDPGQQGDPAWPADCWLFAGQASDAAGVGAGVIQALLQIGGVTQRFVVVELHAFHGDDQGFRLGGVRCGVATCQQHPCHQ